MTYLNARVLIRECILALHVGNHPRGRMPLENARHGCSCMECGVPVRQVCVGDITDNVF